LSGPILIFGAAGQVGRELMALVHDRGVDAIGVTRGEVDITDADAVAQAVADAKPRLIVNCAAYTAVDRAETEPELAAAINATGAGILAQAADRANSPILHISTDYVFDGSKSGPYRENDPIAPLGVYGRSKADGETQVRAMPRHIILRTAWVYGQYGNNFLKTMLRLGAERDRLRVVADQRGCPTATRDIAEAILAVDAALQDDPQNVFGTYHFAGTGATTWHGFAQAIIAHQAEYSGKRPPVDPITTVDFPTPARRPANSELDSSLFADTFAYRAVAWPVRMSQVIDTLLKEPSDQRTA
jgi:dTDP-4-dehydrorhamnose reductase